MKLQDSVRAGLTRYVLQCCTAQQPSCRSRSRWALFLRICHQWALLAGVWPSALRLRTQVPHERLCFTFVFEDVNSTPGLGATGSASVLSHRGRWLSTLRSVSSRTECQPETPITSRALTLCCGDIRCANWRNDIQVTINIANKAKHIACLPLVCSPA